MRTALFAAVAFGDEESVRALNGIVHPAVLAEMDARVQVYADTDRVVVLDIPLLKERKRNGMVAVIVVDTPVDVAVARLVDQRGMTEEDARARISKQISREERLALADFVIDNDGTLSQLERKVADTWAALMADAEPRRAEG